MAWWNRYVFGQCGVNVLPHNASAYCPKRPKLLVISDSARVVVERLTARNSPSFNVQLDGVAGGEVAHVAVDTDRELKSDAQRAKEASWYEKIRTYVALRRAGIEPDWDDADAPERDRDAKRARTTLD